MHGSLRYGSFLRIGLQLDSYGLGSRPTVVINCYDAMFNFMERYALVDASKAFDDVLIIGLI